ncbi:MAG: thiol peroxidase [Candidatus Omnitrophica bacterium]|nr:thiol peroxidase [Candidatus Omnitrophota bacterium]
MRREQILTASFLAAFVFSAWLSPSCNAQENCAPVPERPGLATMKGKPLVLLGHAVKVGQKSPNFVVQATDMSDARLSDFSGKIRLIASVPSLDTPVCDLEIRRFNQEAVSVSKDVVILFVSMDLPFAQKRFCSAADIKNVKTFSDHRTADFGLKYGVLIKGLRLLSRAIFIVDKNGIVRYVQYVKEEGTQPDYTAALKALKRLSTSQ